MTAPPSEPKPRAKWVDRLYWFQGMTPPPSAPDPSKTQSAAGEPDTQNETAPPGGSPQGSRTGTALAGVRARQIDGGSLSAPDLVARYESLKIASDAHAWKEWAQDAAAEIERLRAALMDAWHITNAILNKDQYLEGVHNILSRALFPHIYERGAGLSPDWSTATIKGAREK